MRSALAAIFLALEEQLAKDELPTRRRTRRIARQFGARTSTRQSIDRALKVINFDKLEELCGTQSTKTDPS